MKGKSVEVGEIVVVLVQLGVKDDRLVVKVLEVVVGVLEKQIQCVIKWYEMKLS